MHPSLRSCLRAGFLPASTGLLLLVPLPRVSAQSQAAPSSSQSTAKPTPVPQQRSVITNDNIALPSSPHPTQSSAAPPLQPATLAQKTSAGPTADAAKNATEIAELQKEIRDKRKRIELLMHLFVTDERQFVQSPTDTRPDSAAQTRIHFEQEELHAETAACARLQARLDALTAANNPSH